MFTRRGILPLAGRAFGRILEPHEHRSARRIAHVADLPVMALSAPGAEIMAANRLGLSAETMGEFASIVPCHQAASRSDMRRTG